MSLCPIRSPPSDPRASASQLTADGEAEPRTAMLATESRLHLLERLEDALLIRGARCQRRYQ